MKRVLLLTDEEIELALSWGETAKSLDDFPCGEQRNLVLHDWQDEDDELRRKLEGARLKA